MTSVAHPIWAVERARAVRTPRTAALRRALALGAAACVLIVAGLALAVALRSPATPPIQSQEPAVTSPTAR